MAPNNIPKPTMVLESCRVGRLSDTAGLSLPFSFSDVPWLYFHPTHCLIFYTFPVPKLDGEFAEMTKNQVFGVAGSPKFDLYGTDFGWGKPKKYEALGIDEDGSMSLHRPREFEGGLEIGLSLPV